MIRLLAILPLLCVLSFPANAATLSIDLTAQQATRFQAAVGANKALKDASGQPRAATPAEARQDVIRYMRQTTQDYERRLDAEQFSPPTFDVE